MSSASRSVTDCGANATSRDSSEPSARAVSMPTTVVAGFINATSLPEALRTFSTSSQPKAPAASVISQPAAWKASSVMLAARPAPDWTRSVWPCVFSFLAVSG